MANDKGISGQRVRPPNFVGSEALLCHRLDTISSLIHLLRSFAAILADEKVKGLAADLLPTVLAEAEDLRIRRATVADACQISEATIARWTSGTVTPHPIMARAALEAVCEIALGNASKLEGDAAAIRTQLREIARRQPPVPAN